MNVMTLARLNAELAAALVEELEYEGYESAGAHPSRPASTAAASPPAAEGGTEGPAAQTQPPPHPRRRQG